MRGDPGLQARRGGGPADRLPCALPAHGRPPLVEEDRVGAPPPRRQFRAAAHQVGAQGVLRVGAQGHQALLAALAEEPHDGRPVVQVDVVDGQSHGLADAGARGVEQLEQGRVPEPRRARGGVGGVEESGDLVDAERLGQVGALFGRAHLGCGVGAHAPLAQRVGVQPADGGAGAGHRGGGGRGAREPARRQRRQVGLDVRGAHTGDVRDAPGPQVAGVAADIAPVVRHRVRRRPALDPQVVEPVGGGVLDGVHGPSVSAKVHGRPDRYAPAHIAARL